MIANDPRPARPGAPAGVRMKTLIVHNSLSGFGLDAIYEFERLLLQSGDECTIRLIGAGVEPRDALSDAESFDLVVASGGDGTVANVLYALRYRGVPTCVFPSGTANLLFNAIGNAFEPAAIVEACRAGALVATDLAEMRWVDDEGREHQRGFSMMAGLGFDANIMRTAADLKEAYGEAAYFVAATSNLEPPIVDYEITIDGSTVERSGVSCIVGNNTTITAGIQLVPESRMNDGLIECLVLENERTTQLVSPLLAGLFDPTGETLGRPFVESFRGREIEVRASMRLPLEFDGELVSGTTDCYEVRVLEGANLLVVDPHSPYYAWATRSR